MRKILYLYFFKIAQTSFGSMKLLKGGDKKTLYLLAVTAIKSY